MTYQRRQAVFQTVLKFCTDSSRKLQHLRDLDGVLLKLQDLLRQDKSPWEIILVDNAASGAAPQSHAVTSATLVQPPVVVPHSGRARTTRLAAPFERGARAPVAREIAPFSKCSSCGAPGHRCNSVQCPAHNMVPLTKNSLSELLASTAPQSDFQETVIQEAVSADCCVLVLVALVVCSDGRQLAQCRSLDFEFHELQDSFWVPVAKVSDWLAHKRLPRKAFSAPRSTA